MLRCFKEVSYCMSLIAATRAEGGLVLNPIFVWTQNILGHKIFLDLNALENGVWLLRPGIGKTCLDNLSWIAFIPLTRKENSTYLDCQLWTYLVSVWRIQFTFNLWKQKQKDSWQGISKLDIHTENLNLFSHNFPMKLNLTSLGKSYQVYDVQIMQERPTTLIRPSCEILINLHPTGKQTDRVSK